MTPKMKKEWLDALTGGEYTKIKGIMCEGHPKDKAMCCLAVLADINKARWRASSKDYGLPRKGEYGLTDKSPYSNSYIDVLTLPKRHQKKYGLPQAHHDKLADINDSTADWSEKGGVIDYIKENL